MLTNTSYQGQDAWQEKFRKGRQGVPRLVGGERQSMVESANPRGGCQAGGLGWRGRAMQGWGPWWGYTKQIVYDAGQSRAGWGGVSALSGMALLKEAGGITGRAGHLPCQAGRESILRKVFEAIGRGISWCWSKNPFLGKQFEGGLFKGHGKGPRSLLQH